MNHVPYTTYALIDPTDNTTRYIGITDNLPRRICEHFSLRGSNLLLNAWIIGLAVRGYVPIVKTLALSERKQEAALREAVHIAANQETVFNLLA